MCVYMPCSETFHHIGTRKVRFPSSPRTASPDLGAAPGRRTQPMQPSELETASSERLGAVEITGISQWYNNQPVGFILGSKSEFPI